MGELSRRGFLLGSAAVVAAAAAPVMSVLPEAAPIFKGYVGEYNGIIIREMIKVDLNAAARQGLREWYSSRQMIKMIGAVDDGE